MSLKAPYLFANYYSNTGESLPEAPDYASLSNVEGIWDSTGLVSNTNNDYGQVDSSDNIGAAGWKSIAPGPTGRDMLPIQSTGETAGLSIQTINGITVVDGNGYALLRNTAGKANWNFLHYNATFANLKWTIHMLIRPGFGADPGEFWGMIGNNAASSQQKGFSCYYDDRNTKSDALVHAIGKGTAGAISTSSDNNIITPNTWQVLTLKFDGSLTAANRFKALINGVAASLTVTSASTAVVTTPAFDLEIFASGNGVGIMTGQVSHYVIQSRIESAPIETAFINSLIEWKNALSADNNTRLHVYNTFQEDLTKYYLSTSLVQNPTDQDIILQIFADGTNHVGESTKQISMRKSTDRGLTWSAKTTVHSPVGTLFPQDMGAGYSANGRVHVITDVHDDGGSGAASPHTLVYLYSDDNGANWTTVDLTSTLPADSLVGFRCYTNIIENDGVLMFTIYKFTDEGTFTNSANYLYRSTDGGANWSVVTIRASATDYINESTIIALSLTKLIVISRNEVSNEWTLFESVDNGLNWTSKGALNFGEGMGTPGPCRLKSFVHNSVPVTVCYYPDKSNRLYKAIYAKTSDLVSNSITGWNTSTKVIIVPDFLHYGSVCHYNNDFNAIGSSAREPNPQTNTENKLITYYLPTAHEATMESALGI